MLRPRTIPRPRAHAALGSSWLRRVQCVAESCGEHRSARSGQHEVCGALRDVHPAVHPCAQGCGPDRAQAGDGHRRYPLRDADLLAPPAAVLPKGHACWPGMHVRVRHRDHRRCHRGARRCWSPASLDWARHLLGPCRIVVCSKGVTTSYGVSSVESGKSIPTAPQRQAPHYSAALGSKSASERPTKNSMGFSSPCSRPVVLPGSSQSRSS